MSTYVLQTKTMLSFVSDKSEQPLGLTATRDESRAQLPSKRKRDYLSGLGSFTTPFTIEPYQDSPYDKSATFRPIRITSRSQLPLNFLDTSVDEQTPPNSLFTARIDVLENYGEATEQGVASSKVLIAQHETNRTLFAVERVQDRIYSICKLAPWLKEKDVTYLWDPTIIPVCLASAEPNVSRATGGPWWQHAIVETQPVLRAVKRAKISMVRRPVEIVHTKQGSQQDFSHTTTPPPIGLEGTLSHGLLQEPVAEVPTAQEQLESLVQQYLDAVYTSKTSLAYFAKGPITRIRNTFTSPDEGAPPTHDLVTFLRSMLLSPKAGEKKYYEKLPSVIKAIPVGIVSDEEATSKPSKIKKSKKKTKLSRDGIYPLEDAFVKKWWRSEMPSAENAGQETIETRIRRRIGDLRVRETLAQLILMLEITALESLATYKGPADDEHAQDESQTQPKKRKKKLDDIALQLDLLLDKLSIWHATEEAGILDFDNKAAKQQDNANGDGKSGSDRLHSFCVEVIVPFYMSRLPEQALSINKKLGGPAIASTKRKAMRPPLTSKKSGEAKEPETKRSRRSLARVATDTTGKTGDRRPPSLARSATDTALLRQQSIKRETSEAPLSAIPFKRSPSRARQSMSQLRHLQGREMDLTATSAAAAAKLKHKARVEDDLKEAIATLKKPNRDLAAGSYMADVERRGLGSANRSRKPANPVRKVVKDVQVTATPRAARRTKNVVEQTPVHYHQNPFARPTATEPAPLSDLCIPSSGVRRPSSVVPGTIQRSVTVRELAQPGIAETPSKAPITKVFTSGAARRTIFATPVKSATRLFPEDPHPTSDVFETPIKAAGSPPPAHKHTTPPIVVSTPLKEAVLDVDVAPISFETPVKRTEEASIYDVLGWNDDDDDFA
ncbi:DNA replication regulator SLD3-domain-containing protein [Boeremia exigua]|uniref:DNA replication regulator SLD3-domain-containing protein n=1 Tax=Boeremia exigua TaxID=749465 RepID=UPI001E8D1D9E|nr:DNA replication regulator SLD3-domain-containing protein [Boeremia exigua]KAH6615208.1 DNA replication regulator SLD3-domain-containing protein [Boeremia exigua]